MITPVLSAYNMQDINEAILNIKNEVLKLSKCNLDYLKYRYSSSPYTEVELRDKLDRLVTYREVLTRLKDQILSGVCNCLDKESYSCLMEKVTRLVGKNCKPVYVDYTIDNSNEEEWVMKCPFCRSYENWEKWSKFFAGKLNLQINADTEVLTNLILEISREIITPNVLLAISVYTEVRENLNLEISRSTEEIKLDFELLIEQVPNFDLNLSIYTELIEKHKLSFDIIKTVYDEGLSLEVDQEEVQLRTPVNAYTLAEISGNIDPSYLDKFGMGVTINKKDLLQDYK